MDRACAFCAGPRINELLAFFRTNETHSWKVKFLLLESVFRRTIQIGKGFPTRARRWLSQFKMPCWRWTISCNPATAWGSDPTPLRFFQNNFFITYCIATWHTSPGINLASFHAKKNQNLPAFFAIGRILWCRFTRLWVDKRYIFENSPKYSF